MKFAIIENGMVVNTVIAEHVFAIEHGWVECPDEVGIGWNYDTTNFIDNRPEPVLTNLTQPTKEDLLQQIQDLSAKIQSLT